MTLARLWPPRRLSDEECVERARRSLAQFDRWRFWIILIHFTALVALLAFLVLVAVIFESGKAFANLSYD